MNPLRFLPKMDDLLKEKNIINARTEFSHTLLTVILREELDSLRNLIKNNEILFSDKSEALDYIKNSTLARLHTKKEHRLKPVINATGIIIHTNLGRVPLSKEAVIKILEVSQSYSNLEYNITTGKRGSRLDYIEEILKDLTGTEAAMVVNNNAAAVFLALNTLCKSKEVIVSRGEIVEIGGSFRVSEIIKESGCILKECGTTNKTKISDYEQSVSENTAAFLKVHRSNFKIVGFTHEVYPTELVSLCEKYPEVITILDMGSGILVDLAKYGLKGEQTVQEAVKDNIDVITFSGDKVLGGPQAGIIVGKKKYIDLMKKNQIYRALRIDKLCLAALEATLWQYVREDYENIPVLNGLLANKDDILKKAKTLHGMLHDIVGLSSCVGEHKAMSGGGALPGEEIDSYAIFINVDGKTAAKVELLLREQIIPIIVTVQNDQIVMDMRTVNECDFGYIEGVFRNV